MNHFKGFFRSRLRGFRTAAQRPLRVNYEDNIGIFTTLLFVVCFFATGLVREVRASEPVFDIQDSALDKVFHDCMQPTLAELPNSCSGATMRRSVIKCFLAVEAGENRTALDPLRMIGPNVSFVKTLIEACDNFTTADAIPPVSWTTPAPAEIHMVMGADMEGPQAFHVYVLPASAVGDVVTRIGLAQDLSLFAEYDKMVDWPGYLPLYREMLAVYGGRVMSLPAQGMMMQLYYRRDLFNVHGLRPPHSWDEVISYAKKFNGTDLNGDGELDFGLCMWRDVCDGLPDPFLAVLASLVQRNGLNSGFYFHPESLKPVSETVAWAAALGITRNLTLFAAPVNVEIPSAHNPCFTHPYFSQGRCAMALSAAGQFKSDSAPSNPQSVVRGKIGSAVVPGSEYVLDWQLDALVKCSPEFCPFATQHVESMEAPAPPEAPNQQLLRWPPGRRLVSDPHVPLSSAASAVGGAKDGSTKWVNRAPYAASVGQSFYISRLRSAAQQFAAYHVVVRLVREAGNWQLVAAPWTEFGPTRYEHLDDTSYGRWQEYGYDQDDLRDFLAAARASLASRNVAVEMRSEGSRATRKAMMAVARLVCNISMPLDEVLLASRRLFIELMTPQFVSSLQQSYKASINYDPRNPAKDPKGNDSGSGGGSRPVLYIVVSATVGTVLAVAITACLVWQVVKARGHRPGFHRILPPGVSPATTLCITDIEGSTRLWECLPEAVMSQAVQLHHSCIRNCATAQNGYESATEGDSFILAFHTPEDALLFCLKVQDRLMRQPWPEELLQVDICQPLYLMEAGVTDDDAAPQLPTANLSTSSPASAITSATAAAAKPARPSRDSFDGPANRSFSSRPKTFSGVAVRSNMVGLLAQVSGARGSSAIRSGFAVFGPMRFALAAAEAVSDAPVSSRPSGPPAGLRSLGAQPGDAEPNSQHASHSGIAGEEDAGSTAGSASESLEDMLLSTQDSTMQDTAAAAMRQQPGSYESRSGFETPGGGGGAAESSVRPVTAAVLSGPRSASAAILGPFGAVRSRRSTSVSMIMASVRRGIVRALSIGVAEAGNSKAGDCGGDMEANETQNVRALYRQAFIASGLGRFRRSSALAASCCDGHASDVAADDVATAFRDCRQPSTVEASGAAARPMAAAAEEALVMGEITPARQLPMSHRAPEILSAPTTARSLVGRSGGPADSPTPRVVRFALGRRSSFGGGDPSGAGGGGAFIGLDRASRLGGSAAMVAGRARSSTLGCGSAAGRRSLGSGRQGAGSRLMLRGLRVRIGCHSGVHAATDVSYNRSMARMTYAGMPMTKARAVVGAAQGGMVLVSSATHALFTAGFRAAGGVSSSSAAAGPQYLLLSPRKASSKSHGAAGDNDEGRTSDCSVQFWHAGVHYLDENLKQPLELYLAATPALAPRWAFLAEPGPADRSRVVAKGVLAAPVGSVCMSVITVAGGASIAAWNLGVWHECTGMLWREAASLCLQYDGFLATTRSGAGALPSAGGGGGRQSHARVLLTAAFPNVPAAVHWSANLITYGLLAHWPASLLLHEMGDEQLWLDGMVQLHQAQQGQGHSSKSSWRRAVLSLSAGRSASQLAQQPQLQHQPPGSCRGGSLSSGIAAAWTAAPQPASAHAGIPLPAAPSPTASTASISKTPAPAVSAAAATPVLARATPASAALQQQAVAVSAVADGAAAATALPHPSTSSALHLRAAALLGIAFLRRDPDGRAPQVPSRLSSVSGFHTVCEAPISDTTSGFATAGDLVQVPEPLWVRTLSPSPCISRGARAGASESRRAVGTEPPTTTTAPTADAAMLVAHGRFRAATRGMPGQTSGPTFGAAGPCSEVGSHTAEEAASSGRSKAQPQPRLSAGVHAGQGNLAITINRMSLDAAVARGSPSTLMGSNKTYCHTVELRGELLAASAGIREPSSLPPAAIQRPDSRQAACSGGSGSSGGGGPEGKAKSWPVAAAAAVFGSRPASLPAADGFATDAVRIRRGPWPVRPTAGGGDDRGAAGGAADGVKGGMSTSLGQLPMRKSMETTSSGLSVSLPIPASRSGSLPVSLPTPASAPVPSASAPVPSASAPVPSASAPVPSGSDPVPSGSDLVPSGSAPVPSGSDPVPSGSDPVPSGSAPVPVPMPLPVSVRPAVQSPGRGAHLLPLPPAVASPAMDDSDYCVYGRSVPRMFQEDTGAARGDNVEEAGVLQQRPPGALVGAFPDNGAQDPQLLTRAVTRAGGHAAALHVVSSEVEAAGEITAGDGPTASGACAFTVSEMSLAATTAVVSAASGLAGNAVRPGSMVLPASAMHHLPPAPHLTASQAVRLLAERHREFSSGLSNSIERSRRPTEALRKSGPALPMKVLDRLISRGPRLRAGVEYGTVSVMVNCVLGDARYSGPAAAAAAVLGQKAPVAHVLVGSRALRVEGTGGAQCLAELHPSVAARVRFEQEG